MSVKPWLWAWVAAGLAFGATLILTGVQGAGELAYAALSFGAFAAIVGMGQMLVITLGPGNVDLSIPACMTLAGTLALKAMGSDPGTA